MGDRASDPSPVAAARLMRQPRPWPLVNLGAALLAAALVLYLCFFGWSSLPPLGKAFNPDDGAWSMAADARPPTSQKLVINGLRAPVQVVLEKDGTAHLVASSDHDLFLALGYVEARFRLFQMDLLRRQGEGRLSQVVGSAALPSDRFELELGLLRTARAEWSQMASGGASHDALVAYAKGVNDRLAEDFRRHDLPAMFKLLGYGPAAWTPIDSLIVKGDMTQDLDFTTWPLTDALLAKALGEKRAATWFGVLPPNGQSPYDTTTHTALPPAVIPALPVSNAEATASSTLLAATRALLPGEIASGGNSNNWAVDGSRSASGAALLANDPHLHLTLPSIWFQFTADAPGYHTAGVGIPGTPVLLLGHNRHIAWGLTDTQNQATLYYQERTSRSHPDSYLWNGVWTRYRTVDYRIPVRGRSPVPLRVRLTVHGPVLTQMGQTMSVWWAGNLPSDDLGVLLAIGRAANWEEFKAALRDWHAPSQNFAYADDRGNIGLISAGYYPLTAAGNPWLPLPGTGAYDVTGTIPFQEVPQVYDPPGHVIWSANQRPVPASYPYYIGTTLDFAPGYRANEIHRMLSGSQKLSLSDMEAIQNDTRDYLAAEIVPRLLQALGTTRLTAQQQQASSILARWDDRMETGSAGASIWWTFWNSYLKDTFTPWWTARHVKVPLDSVQGALGMDLEAWTLSDPSNPAFSPPNASSQDSSEVMVRAFADALEGLTRRLGPDPSTWTWGKIHSRELESLAQIPSLAYGPAPAPGDAFTPNASPGDPSTHGPSWRMIVDWAGKALGSYPGGQSENPASPWYQDRAGLWWWGGYAPILGEAGAARRPGSVTWKLEP